MTEELKKQWRGKAKRDFVVALVLLTLFWIVAISLDLFEYMHGSIHSLERWEFDELLVAMLFLAIVASWFSYRRWREASFEAARANKVESALKLAQSIAHVGSWHWNQLRDSSYWSPEMYLIHGVEERHTPPQFEQYLQSVPPDDRLLFQQTLDLARQQGAADCEFRYEHAAGAMLDLQLHAIASYDENGTLIALDGTVQDISELRMATRRVNEVAEQMQSLLSVTTDGFWLVDQQGVILECNQGYADMIGYSVDEVVGCHISDFEVDENSAEIAAHIRRLQASAFERFETRHRCLDGSLIHLEISAALIHNQQRMVGFIQNISERKQALEDLHRSEAKFAGIVGLAADAIVSVDHAQKIVLFNHAAEEMFGCDAASVMGGDIDKLIPERFRAAHRQHLDAFVRHGGKGMRRRREGMLGLRANGEEFPIEMSVSRQQIGDEVVLTAMIRDITEQVKSQLSQRKMLKAIGEAGEGIMITDRNGVIEYVNPAFCAISGYDKDEVLGKTPSILKSDAQDPGFYKDMWRTITRGEVWHGTLIDRRKDGTFYPALMSVAPIHDENDRITHFVSLQQDMTEFRRLEDQFLQAQKMEAIGTLVGGIAHDFNNMLAAIQGNIFMARRDVTDAERVETKLANVEQISNRAAAVVRQLLTFARKDRVAMREIALNDFIREALKLAGSAIPEDMILESDITSESMTIKGDATQLQQILMNLLNNARDAVEQVDEPRIRVSLSHFEKGPVFCREHPDLAECELACIEVSDNGRGIPDVLVDKVFEPFFTTKEAGKGTGLGLAMVYGAVKAHGGCIKLESNQGQGTSIRFCLPLIRSRQLLVGEESQDAKPGGGELVLLVDDEVVLRNSTSELLTGFGYRVITAKDGVEAMALFEQHHKEVHLMISDVVMPRMGGMELARHVREIAASVPIILVTGYDRDRVIQPDDMLDHCVVLNKPFHPLTLHQWIDKMLS